MPSTSAPFMPARTRSQSTRSLLNNSINGGSTPKWIRSLKRRNMSKPLRRCSWETQNSAASKFETSDKIVHSRPLRFETEKSPQQGRKGHKGGFLCLIFVAFVALL